MGGQGPGLGSLHSYFLVLLDTLQSLSNWYYVWPLSIHPNQLTIFKGPKGISVAQALIQTCRAHSSAGNRAYHAWQEHTLGDRRMPQTAHSQASDEASAEERVPRSRLRVLVPGLPGLPALGTSLHFLHIDGNCEYWGRWYFVPGLVLGNVEENVSFYSSRFFGWSNHQINIRQINKFNYICTGIPIGIWDPRRSGGNRGLLCHSELKKGLPRGAE